MSFAQVPTDSHSPLHHFIEECPLCGSADSKVIHEEKNDLPPGDSRLDPFRNDSIYLKECSQCAFATVDKLPTDTGFFEAIYTHLKPDWHVEFFYHGKKEINQEIRKSILKYKTSGRMLDIGCWAGSFLAAMQDRFSVQGIELNPDGVLCARKQGLQVTQTSIDQASLPANSLDVVTLIDVLEHLPNPSQVLEKVTRALVPGGLIYIKVPNYKGQLWKQELLRKLKLTQVGIMQNYVHINHFSRKSLSTKLESLGYRVVETGFTRAETWDLSAPQAFKLKWRRWLRNRFVNTLTALLNRFSEWTGVEVGLNLYVIAIKR